MPRIVVSLVTSGEYKIQMLHAMSALHLG